MDTHGGRSHLYLIQLRIWVIFYFVDSVDEGQKMNNPMQISMAVEVIYIFYSCVFGLSFISMAALMRDKI